MPTRVIDVGDGDTVYLVETVKLSQREHYVSLSHCWGQAWKDKWSTTTGDKDEKMKGFLVKELSQTFQDTIRVTRELGKRYLWIDSLCIIQGSDRD